MRVYNNNLFNRIFHRADLQRQHDERRELASVAKIAETAISQLEKCQDLYKMLDIHKWMWNNGVRNNYLAPNPYGFFRCDDIATMTADQVFLGNIYGLWTKTIPEWEKYQDEKFGTNIFGIDADLPVYSIIVYQYRMILLRNARLVKQHALDKLSEIPIS